MTTTADQSSDDSLASESAPRSRRTAIQALALGGVAAAGALVGGGAVASGARSSDEVASSATFDCALLGDTWRMTGYENEDPADLRGSSFFVEGWLYPGNFIPDGPGFIPTKEGSIGHWLCHGNLISHPGRPQPHIMSFQEYIFGHITDDEPAPPNMMTSVGLEGMDRDFYPMHRALTGGTGDYLGASGQVIQMYVGSNATIMLEEPSPNIRFEFALV